MNNSTEVAKFKTGPTFEKNINEIKDNHLKSIASAVMNISAITFFDDNLEPLSMNNSSEAEKLGPGTTF